MAFESDGLCFVCGEKNAGGLRLKFKIDRENLTLRTTFVSPPTYQGWDGLIHGGIVTTLLDEAMAKLAYELGYDAVTATLEVRFRNPAPILKPLQLFGEITEVRKRLVRAKARIEKEDGTIVAQATSTLMRVSRP